MGLAPFTIDWSPVDSEHDSITSYGDRPNTFDEASEYFRAHFLQVHRRKDVGKRSIYVVRPWQRLALSSVFPSGSEFDDVFTQHFTSMLVGLMRSFPPDIGH